jgi:protease PrsW
VLVLTANSMQQQLLELGRVPSPTPEQVHLFTILTWSFLAIDAILGIMLLRSLWRAGDRTPATT